MNLPFAIVLSTAMICGTTLAVVLTAVIWASLHQR